MDSYVQDSPKGVPCHQQDSYANRQLSSSIPLPNSHVARTQSELQLSEDMAAAERRDLCMFYRILRGIRERQDAHAVPIYGQRFGRNENSRPMKGTSQDIAAMDGARVTPFESSTGNLPLQHGERVRDPVASLPPSVRASTHKDNGWSITGFDEDLQEPYQYAIIEEDTSDDAIFEMDL